MGFSNGSYAKIWKINIPEGAKRASVNITISRKDKATGEYKTVFSGFVNFVGEAFNKVKSMQSGSRVRLTETDVESKYDKEKDRTSYFFTVWNFEELDNSNANSTVAPATTSNDDGDIPF